MAIDFRVPIRVRWPRARLGVPERRLTAIGSSGVARRCSFVLDVTCRSVGNTGMPDGLVRGRMVADAPGYEAGS